MKEIFGVLLFIALGYFFYNWYADRNSWTLIVCKNKMANDVECYDTSYKIPGFKSSKECLLEGASKFSKDGFECGRDCKNDGDLNICQQICNKSGCN